MVYACHSTIACVIHRKVRLPSPSAWASHISRTVALTVLAACSAASLFAQHTVVEENGAGKIQTDYNAAKQVTQMRTLGADGKLQQKVEYEYLPGYYGAQQTDTTYWPNGTIRKTSRHTYDESSNFTGEFIQTFDESGQQIAGHKLTHDPWTGVYRCFEWSAALQGYKSVDCPAGEEESGGAEERKKFTYDEVMQQLEAARKTARQEQDIVRTQPATAGQPPVKTADRELGLVLPAQLRPGERVSGTVVENPDQYEEIPEITITRVRLPFEAASEGSRLSGWLLEAPSEGPRPAEGPFTFVVPRRSSGMKITFRQAGNPVRSVSATVNLRQSLAKTPRAPRSFQVAALCLKDGLCTVSGPFSGNSSKTFAAFESRPATILAETSGTAYIRIPELTEPGVRPLFIAEGRKVVALPVVVGEFVIKNNHRTLDPGQTLIMVPTLDGPGDIAEAQWRPGSFPATNITRARTLIPGFHLPQEKDAARELSQEPQEKREAEEEKNEGEILLVIKNATREQVSLRGSKNGMLVFHLSDEAFRRGEFRYDLLVEAKTAGKVEVRGYVIPFLAPIAGQEFEVQAAVPSAGPERTQP